MHIKPVETAILPAQQRTLRGSIGCSGVGLHSGKRVNLTMHPAPVGTGIVFRRTDLGVDIPALYNGVVDTRLCTVLAAEGRPDARVSTVEHVMAALAACSIDNAIIDVDSHEIPILDGSSAPFVFLIESAGVISQAAPRRVIEVLRSVYVSDGEATAELHPGTVPSLVAHVSINFQAEAIGSQSADLTLTGSNFTREIAKARTFTQATEVAYLRSVGLALGGSLDNAVVVDGSQVLNPGGLRMQNEFAAHKLLDAVGDLALAGAPLQARFIGHRTGHALNNRVLHALFADPANWRWSDDTATSRSAAPRLPVSAAASPAL